MSTSLEQQLKLEARTCPQCRFEIINPFVERCPRCLASLPFKDPGCSFCIHNAGCSMASIKEATRR